MKKFKLISLVLALMLAVCLFVGCGGGGEDLDDGDIAEGSTLYTYEAEDTNLIGKQGSVYSGEAAGYQMVVGAAQNIDHSIVDTFSNDHIVSYFNNVGSSLEFKVNSDKATTGDTLYFRMASEWGALKVTQDNIKITVNDEAVDFSDFTVAGVSSSSNGEISAYKSAAKDYKIGNVNLKAGANEIKIEVLEVYYGVSTLKNNHGPGIDAMKIVSEGALTWDKLWEANKPL